MRKIIHSYKCGQKHTALGKLCEDRTFAMTLDGVSVMVLADGAGSEKYTHSDIGAECIVDIASRFLCKNFDKLLTTSAEECKNAFVSICQNELMQKAKEFKLDSIVYFSSTLLAVAVKDDDAIIFHIGDGVIGKYTDKGFAVVSAPDNGEFVGTTYFMTLADAPDHLDFIREKTTDVKAYFMMSDGVSEYVYDEFNDVFTDAVLNFINMADDENGSLLLGDAMKKYIIDNNSFSDDCSFACLKLDNAAVGPIGMLSDTDSDGGEYAEYPEDVQKESVSETRIDYKSINQQKRKKSKRIIIGVASAILLLIAIFVLKSFVGNDDKDSAQPTIDVTQTAIPLPTYTTTFVTQGFSESTTEISDTTTAVNNESVNNQNNYAPVTQKTSSGKKPSVKPQNDSPKTTNATTSAVKTTAVSTTMAEKTSVTQTEREQGTTVRATIPQATFVDPVPIETKTAVPEKTEPLQTEKQDIPLGSGQELKG